VFVNSTPGPEVATDRESFEPCYDEQADRRCASKSVLRGGRMKGILGIPERNGGATDCRRSGQIR
jgi:hypothetical protein